MISTSKYYSAINFHNQSKSRYVYIITLRPLYRGAITLFFNKCADLVQSGPHHHIIEN